MTKEGLTILIIGAGSIGERHIRNLLTLNYQNIFVFRQRNLPLRSVDPKRVTILTEWIEVEKLLPEVVFITSPTAFHLKQAIDCAKLGAHLFIEKPLGSVLEDNAINKLQEILAQHQRHIQVGYMMRYYPLLQKVKQAIETDQYGHLISFHSHWGEYLPAWHPWEDYRTSYAARRDLGGGVALTLSHDIDTALWMAGSPLKNYHIIKSYKNQLDLEVEGAAEILFHFDNEVVGHVHLNFVQRNPERIYEYRFDQATVKIDFYEHSLTIYYNDSKTLEKMDGYDRNDLFLAQTKDFMQRIDQPEQQFNQDQLFTSKSILAICEHKPLPVA